MTSPLASRAFNLDDQRAFAKLSSDWNPLHLDAASARRSQVGAPIVHGIHTLVWSANAVLQRCPLVVANMRARFLQPLYLDEPASLSIKKRTDKKVEFEVTAAGTTVVTVKLSSEPGKSSVALKAPQSAPPPMSEPANPAFEQLARRSGAVSIPSADLQSLFPALAAAIGTSGIKALLATSQIIGMACPGLHSLFTGLDINFDRSSASQGALAYEVSKVDARFRSLQIDVSGFGAHGRLDAFARPAPPVQATIVEIARRVGGKPFAGQRSLIIGGSRGLGEVTAKIVAAGGGEAIITYKESKREAEQVSAEMRGAGYPYEAVRYDALSPAREQLQALPKVNCCYFFATPKIFGRKSQLYEQDKLRTFLRFYTDSFYDLCSALAGAGSGKIAMFYPSTTAISDPVNTLAEYAMAKAAGETLADSVNAFMPGIRVLHRRLPRILTDQTATIGVAASENALDVMLPIVHEVQQMARAAS
jgi:MaoC like domain